MTTFLFLIISIEVKPAYYTNTNYVYKMTVRDTIVYGATNGGIVAYNFSNENFGVLTNTDGLQQNRQSCLGLDSTGYLWVGNTLGLAQIDTNFSDIRIYPSDCLTCNIIQDIYCLRDSIYVGSSNGLLFIETKGTPQDFSDDTQIKIFEIQGLPCSNVKTIAVDDTSIWVGTATGGVAQFTKDFSTVRVYNTSHGLLDNEINKIAIIDTKLYVGTPSGLNRLRDTLFDTLLMNYQINDISYLGDSLVLALNTPFQVGIFYQNTVSIINGGLPYGCKVLSLASMNNNLFCGLGNRDALDYYGEGVGIFNGSTNSWAIKKNKCIGSNHISEITSNEFGIFIACGRRRAESRGFAWLNNDSEWMNFTADSVITTNNVHRCVTAPDGKVWFGNNAFPNDTSSVMIFSFDPANDEWHFIRNRYNGMEGTVAIWDIEFDIHNNMYLALAGPSDKLWIIDSTLETPYFLGSSILGFNVEIAIDSTGKIWRTMTDAGLLMIDTKNTLFDRNDDDTRNFTTSDGLLSNITRGCIVDKANNLYVATDNGLSIYNYNLGNFSNITNISQQDLLDVELDSEGRIWILARDGIYYNDRKLNLSRGWRFSEIGVHIEFIESLNEIIQVQGFEFDPIHGCFWVGSENGLLKLSILYDTTSVLENVLIYPNPVIGQSVVRIKNIPLESQVNIYSIAGRLVAKNLSTDPVFGEAVWEIPQDTGSGLYFVLIKSQQGTKVCKFAIIK